jgi:hypothetical protein
MFSNRGSRKNNNWGEQGEGEALRESLISVLSKISCLWMGNEVTLYVECGKD